MAVDAVIAVPDQPGQHWVLSGDNYTRIALAGGEPHKDTVINSGVIADDWPSLADFGHVDSAVPVPDKHGQYWVFSGDQYRRIALADGEPHKDTVVNSGSITQDWPSLSQAQPA